MNEAILKETASENEALLNYICRRRLDKSYIETKCKLNPSSFCVPLFTLKWRWWRQERMLTTDAKWRKSKTEYGSTWCYFLNWRDKTKDIILIVEWEIDFLSIIPFANDYILLWLKWINNLPHCIKDIETLQKTYDVYLLVDNDMAAEDAIKRIPYTPLHLYDVRDALSWYKDVNDAICNDALNMSVLPKRIVKLKPKPKKKFSFNSAIDTLDEIDRTFSAIDVLETLFPEYRRRWTECILENWKETSWYKYSKRLNIVKDFSWKGRPEGGPYQIAKAKFWDSKLAFAYFKWKI